MKKKLILLVVFACAVIFAAELSFTSLVIDARELKLSRSMAPKILNESGLEIYGTILNERDLAKVMETGVVAYTDSLENAKKFLAERLGENPLLVKAKGVVGSNGSNIVLSNEDAARILKLNRTQKFLEKFNVIVLISPEVE